MYEHPDEVGVLLHWIDDEQAAPWPARCRCQVSDLMPVGIIGISIYPPDDSGYMSPWDILVTIFPEFNFQVWMQIEDQPWAGDIDWTWTDDDLTPDELVDDLSDGLYNADHEGVFTTFSRLRGGQVEIVRLNLGTQ